PRHGHTVLRVPPAPLLYVFHCYGSPRDLHSFPTRRSSDLADLLQHHVEPAAVMQEGVFAAQHRQRPRMIFLRLLRPKGAVELDGDRKSTRLNSSHVKISYAVFCLKKKKNTDSNKVRRLTVA